MNIISTHQYHKFVYIQGNILEINLRNRYSDFEAIL